MSGAKNRLVILGFTASISMIAVAVSVMLLSLYYSRSMFDLVKEICGEVAERDLVVKSILAAAIKEHAGKTLLFASISFATGILFFFLTFWRRNRMEAVRIQALAKYLEQATIGRAPVLSAFGEDEFAKLEDEIYKTVTYLYHTKDSAVRA